MVKVDSKPQPQTIKHIGHHACLCRIDNENDAKRILRNLVEEIIALDSIAMVSSATNSELNKALLKLREMEDDRRRLYDDNDQLSREVLKLRSENTDLRNRVQELELENCSGPPSGHLRITQAMQQSTSSARQPVSPTEDAKKAKEEEENQLREQEHGEAVLWSVPDGCEDAAAWERTGQWVWRHSGVQMDYEPLGDLERSCCDSSTVASSEGEEHCLLSLCDSASSSEAEEVEAVATRSAPHANANANANARISTGALDATAARNTTRGRPGRVERERRGSRQTQMRLQPQGTRKGSSANKVARPPWKTSVDVNPVYSSKSIFGRLMGGIQDRAAASGVIADALPRENIASF